MLRLTYQELVEARELLSEGSTLTYDQLFKRSDPKRTFRSGQVRGPPLEMDSYKDAVFHTFNFKSFPSTTGLRHRGYIKFEKPSHGRPTPSEKLPVVVDCNCPDFRYRWAWANKQRGASRVGSQSMNQALDRAPRITNPQNKVGLCKHLLAARNYIYGLIQKFDKEQPASQRVRGRGTQDLAWKLDQLVKLSTKKWINWDADKDAAMRRQGMQRQVQQARNIGGPMPAAEVPPNIDNEMPVPLPPGQAPPPRGRGGPPEPPLPPEPGQPPAQPPPPPDQRARRNRRNQNPEESIVVKSTANKSIVDMNKDLLNRTKALVEGLENDQELAADVTHAALGDEGGHPEADAGGLPPPPAEDELSDLPPEAGMEGGAPEDEALGLLRDIATGIDRIATEIAPIEAGVEGAEGAPPVGPEEGDETGEGEESGAKKDEPGVPPVEDDDDEFAETMPVATGA